jgi:hypothetical protein
MKELASVSLSVMILTINLIPFFIVLGILFPARVAKALDIASTTPGRAFWIGAVNFLFLLTIDFVLFSLANKVDGLFKAILVFPAIGVTAILSIALSFGLGSMASLIGERFTPGQPAWKQVLWGTLFLGLGSSVPFVGWFLLLPYTAWVGVGAFIISLFKKTSQ